MIIKRRWRVWWAGLIQGTIHGTATSIGAVMGLGAANAVGITIPQLTPKQFLIVLFWAAFGSGVAYLRTSPWAKAEDDTEVLIKMATTPVGS